MVKGASIEKKPASFYKRILAYIIDIIIIDLIIVWPFKTTLENLSVSNNFGFYLDFQTILNNPNKVTQLLIISLAILILSLAYWSILEFKLRQSIGKMLVNIKVASKRKDFSISQCIVRNISKTISVVFLFDIVYLIFNKKQNQRYFEKISDTIVIEEVLKI